ncbi:MAG: tRNA (adenosine(37)-N6)-dimethylallyltransferase MiaA [Candidatus Aureabacteria bacterium]|nr:tRNA (adenosine(37)-N6)-dimethylallyltransferase MiaA [Candidatus Auribacterota bacterium]
MPDIIFIVGQTAVGKSAVAIELARKIGAEILSADSMQIYRGLDILSAKPSPAERQAIPHHLIDIADPRERFDVARYVRLAREAVANIRGHGRVPVVGGGSGMYVRALLDGIFTGPGRDAVLRDRLEREVAEEGLAPLYERLKEVDPGAAARIHPNDRKRIIRALEVFEVSGKNISSQQGEWRGEGRVGDAGVFFSRNLGCEIIMIGMRREKESLRRRIEERVERMCAGGALEEVRALLGAGIDPHATIWQSLGIKELRAHIEGDCSLAEAMEALKKNTMAFAKRQMTWFGRDPRIQWLDIQEGQTPDTTAEKIMYLLARDGTRTTED